MRWGSWRQCRRWGRAGPASSGLHHDIAAVRSGQRVGFRLVILCPGADPGVADSETVCIKLSGDVHRLIVPICPEPAQRHAVPGLVSGTVCGRGLAAPPSAIVMAATHSTTSGTTSPGFFPGTPWSATRSSTGSCSCSPDPIGPVSERLDAWSDAMDLADTSTPRWSRICRCLAHSAGSDLYLLLAAQLVRKPRWAVGSPLRAARGVAFRPACLEGRAHLRTSASCQG